MATIFGLDINNEIPEVDNTIDVSTGNVANSTAKTADTLYKREKDITNPYGTNSYKTTALTAQDTVNAMNVTETPEEAVQDTGSASNVVTTDELESASVGEFKLPSPSEPTGELSYTPTVNKDTDTQAKIDELNTQIADKRKLLEVSKAKDALEVDKQNVFSAIENIGNLGDFILDVEAQEGLQKKREELTAITNKINAKELEFRRQIESIQDAPGLTRAQKNARIAEVDRRNSREIADLEIIAMARQGRFNDAQAAVDRKVQIELADRQVMLEGMKFIYEENKDRFSTDELRAYNERILSEERSYQKEYDRLKELEDLKLQMTINATEAGAGIGELEAIQRAGDTTSLFSVPNAQRYMKTKAQVLDEQLTALQISKASQDLAYANQTIAQGGISPVTGKPYTQDQTKDGLFASRIDDAEDTLGGGRQSVFMPEWLAPEWAKSQERRQWEQAENNFITATLRKESGAQIAEEEYATARKVYIPVWGDDAKTLADKKQARERVLNTMKTGSGGFYEELQANSTSGEYGNFTVDSYLDVVEGELFSPSGIYQAYQ